MSIPMPFRRGSRRDQIRQDWIDEKLHEARIVVADVVNHSDHLIRIACNVLVQHGETPTEREDARILQVVLEARSTGRSVPQPHDPEDRR
jgi:hypothetical protein